MKLIRTAAITKTEVKIMTRDKSPGTKVPKFKRLQFIFPLWERKLALIEGYFHGSGEWVAAAMMD